MNLFNLKKIAIAATAVAALGSAAGAHATGTVEVFNRAVMGSADYGFMGYTDDTGNVVDLTGQKILGAWVEIHFTPAQYHDVKVFTMQMVVPVEDVNEPLFTIHSKDLIPMGKGRYRAMLSSREFNGIVRAGRYSIETFGSNAKGERVDLWGALDETSGYHFIVTRPE